MNKTVRRYECGNCGHVDTDATLRLDIPDYYERVDADGPEPAGECSECRCLSYAIREDGPTGVR